MKAGTRRVLACISLLWVTGPAWPGTIEEARNARQAGDFSRAIAIFEELAAAAPANPSLLLELGTVQGWAGQYDRALATLTRGLALAPGNTDLRLARARVLSWSGQWDAAEAALREILQVEPENADALIALGRLQLWRNDADAAAATFEQVLTRSPRHLDALVGRGDAARLRRQPDEARSFYTRAAAVEPGSAEIRQRIESVRPPPKWRIDAGFEFSWFGDDTRADWHDWHFSTRRALGERTGVALSFEHADRFGLTDRHYAIAVDHRFSTDLGCALRVGGTPAADFLPRRLVAIEATGRLREGTASLPATLVSADYRVAAYVPGTAQIAALGVTQFISRGVSLTLKGLASSNFADKWKTGMMVRLEGEPDDRWRWYVGVGRGHESLAATAFDYLQPNRVRALVGGIAHDFNPSFGARVDLTRETSDLIPRREAVHAGIVIRF